MGLFPRIFRAPCGALSGEGSHTVRRLFFFKHSLLKSIKLVLLGSNKSFELVGLGSENLDVVLLLLDQLHEVGSLSESWTWHWSSDDWLSPNGTLEHLVRPVSHLESGSRSADMLGDLGDSNNLLVSDQLLVDSSDGSLVSMEGMGEVSDLSGDLVDSSLEDSLLVDELVDGVSDVLDNLWSWSADVNLGWSSSQRSDLSDDVVDLSSDDVDLSSDDGNLLSQDSDSLLQDWSLWSWGGNDLLSDDSDLSGDLGDVVGQLNDSSDSLDDGSSDVSDLLLDRGWVHASQTWGGESSEVSGDHLAGFPAIGSSGGHSIASGVARLSLSGEFGDLLGFLSVVSTGEDWLQDSVSLGSDGTEGVLLNVDGLSNNSDLMGQLLDGSSQDGDLLSNGSSSGGVGLWNGLQAINKWGDLVSDDSDSLDDVSDHGGLLSDDLLDVGDSSLLGWGEDGDWSSSDHNNLVVDLSDGLSDVSDLLGDVSDNGGVVSDLLGEGRSSGWLSLDSSHESSDSSSDDSSLSGQLVNSDVELSNNLSESNDLLLNWLWSEAHLRWGSEFLAVMGNGVASGVAIGFLAGDKVELSLHVSELSLEIVVSWGGLA